MTWRTHGNGYDDDDDVAVSGDYDATAAADDDDDDDGVAAVTARGSKQQAACETSTLDPRRVGIGLDWELPVGKRAGSQRYKQIMSCKVR